MPCVRACLANAHDGGIIFLVRPSPSRRTSERGVNAAVKTRRPEWTWWGEEILKMRFAEGSCQRVRLFELASLTLNKAEGAESE